MAVCQFIRIFPAIRLEMDFDHMWRTRFEPMRKVEEALKESKEWLGSEVQGSKQIQAHSLQPFPFRM